MSFVNKFGESTIKYSQNKKNFVTKEYLIKTYDMLADKINIIRKELDNISMSHQIDMQEQELILADKISIIREDLINISTSHQIDMKQLEQNNKKIVKDLEEYFNKEIKKVDKISSDVEKISNALQSFIVNSTQTLNKTIKNQILSENKEYRNKIEERFSKIEEIIFKWIGMEELQKQYTNHLDEIKSDQKIFKEAIAKNEKLFSDNLNSFEERLYNIENYLFKTIGIKAKN